MQSIVAVPIDQKPNSEKFALLQYKYGILKGRAYKGRPTENRRVKREAWAKHKTVSNPTQL